MNGFWATFAMLHPICFAIIAVVVLLIVLVFIILMIGSMP
jgi:hypothetical protein